MNNAFFEAPKAHNKLRTLIELYKLKRLTYGQHLNKLLVTLI